MLRRFLFIIGLCAVQSPALVPRATAGINDNAKIAAHLEARLTKGAPSCAGAPTPACNTGQPSLNVHGTVGVAYNMYVVVLDGDATTGLAGATFGLTYGSNLYVGGWNLCADLQFPGGPPGVNWPASGSGNIITWNPQNHCQDTPAPNDLDGGVTAVLGSFYVYAYGQDVLEITDRKYVSTPEFQVADCSAEAYDLLLPDHAGRVGFGASTDGYDPCLGVDPSELLRYRPQEVVTSFHPSLVKPPLGAHEGSLDDFSFADPTLRALLDQLSVSRLRKVLPWFEHQSVHTQDVLGRPVTLPNDMADLYVLSLADTSVVEAVAVLTGDSVHVAYAEPNFLRRTAAMPSDPKFPQQWWLHAESDGQAWTVDDEDIDAPEGWDIATTGPIRVAVLDTGIDYDQQDLGEVIQGPNFAEAGNSSDRYGHGTAVAGIIGARANNGVNGAGINWGAELVAVQVCDDLGGCPTDAIVAGIDYARTHSARVINMSLGGPTFGASEQAALKNSHAAGVLNVAAMGNTNNRTRQYPSGYDRFVVAVGAIWANGDRWSDAFIDDLWGCGYTLTSNCGSPDKCGSSYGDWIDLAAPGGRSILTTDLVVPNPFRTGRYDEINGPCVGGFGGTSAATPMVSGVASLLLSLGEFTMDGEDLEQVLIRTAVDKPQYGPGFDAETGHGMVNLAAALEFVTGGRARTSGVEASATTHAVRNRNMRFFGVPGLSDGTYFTEEYELRAAVSFPNSYLGTPAAWGKTLGSIGWRDANPHVEAASPAGYAEVVPGSVGFSGMTLRTYVYQVFDVNSKPVGWYPTSPAGARLAWTAVGPSAVTAVGDDRAHPSLGLRSLQNPVVGRTLIRFELPERQQVGLTIYDIAGRRVRTLADGEFGAGAHFVEWDAHGDGGRSVASGMYFSRLSTPQGARTGTMIVVR